MISLIIFLLLIAVNLGIALAKHGEYKTGIDAQYNFWVTLISAVIDLILLWGMGVFSLFGA
jgi:hypothetical protein